MTLHPFSQAASRRQALAVLAAAGLASSWLAGAVLAQEKYPARPVTLVVPQAAGGANDVLARVLAQRLAEQLGQSVVVDNRPGAGGTRATAALSRTRGDGYTLLVTTDSAQVIAPALYKNPGFDPEKDFIPVAPIARAGYVLVAHPDFGANDMAGLIALAKEKPGHYAIASAGNGTLNHLMAALLQKAAGIELLHVPYKGSAAAATDVVSGQVPLSVQSLPSVMGFVQSGKLKVLGVVNPERTPALPDVPTINETLPGFGAAPWYALFAPAGTPEPIVTQLQGEVQRALAHPQMLEKLGALGCEPFVGTAADLGQLVRSDRERWAKAVKETGVTID
ncbi:tripartite tricarboxylate transporter substrate binding protein [Comamonadaceae bacterium OH2310_COT-174]|uniref:Bug family tripartite tricarboxylate transporter substrate binding protein n=1 Tax=Vandammella animalimorsus TaxID=2029117 RepID=UPI000F5F2E6B|nr:tripartite tricarboxylate transporter substrate binding protein [Comamonadaceae bacterium OH2310_COT-174]